MLRLGRSILTQLISPSSTPPISQLHRLFSAAAPSIPPNPSFAVEEYLVQTCGLTRYKALKASGKISHLKPPSNPDAVLAFLADDLGLSSAAVATAVAKDPQLLCANVEKTLAANVAGLTALGMSRSEIARLVSLAPSNIRLASTVSKLLYYRPLLGSYENILRVLKSSPRLLECSLEKVARPNVALLRECGLGVCDIAKLCIARPWLLAANLERLHVMVACAEGLGVPRGSVMFRHALHAVAYLNDEKIAAQAEYLKKTFRWSDAEVRTAASKLPLLLTRSKDNLKRRSEFLVSEVGLEPPYISDRPALLSYSLERRLRPRYYVVKFLKENGLLDLGRSYYSAVIVTEKVFVDKYISPHKETAPHLSEDYAAACRGQVPTSFRFASTKNGP